MSKVVVTRVVLNSETFGGQVPPHKPKADHESELATLRAKVEELERERDEARAKAAKFVRCGSDLTVNRNEVASVEWDRRWYANGSASWLIITMNSGKQYRLENGRGYYGGADCYAIEKEITGA